MIFKDSRIKQMNEILNGIKVCMLPCVLKHEFINYIVC